MSKEFWNAVNILLEIYNRDGETRTPKQICDAGKQHRDMPYLEPHEWRQMPTELYKYKSQDAELEVTQEQFNTSMALFASAFLERMHTEGLEGLTDLDQVSELDFYDEVGLSL